ncbi:hypothetical protein [Methanobrevibacter filiformis]|uniref:Uncharacterized protein n=1 Tax=Methanobrevibacter filiformis TaxID=55758 RepID=A0A166E8L0_9EURY|nr:hypothetical protein [Methanobrevibacter filiformis]KZX16392.1 hypothetical protein MBFIL_05190 [Methanobrevibacter filiformis]
MQNEKSINRNKNSHIYYNNLAANLPKPSTKNTNEEMFKHNTDIHPINCRIENNNLFCGENDSSENNYFNSISDNGETATAETSINYIRNSTNNSVEMDVGELIYNETKQQFTFKDQIKDMELEHLTKIQTHKETKQKVNSVVKGEKRETAVNSYKIKIGEDIIFFYNNENYSSEVLDIKHDNLKVVYRSKNVWINLTDVKKIL